MIPQNAAPFPEGKIVLLDGRQLDCYEKTYKPDGSAGKKISEQDGSVAKKIPEQDSSVDDKGNSCPGRKGGNACSDLFETLLFTDNAFLFLRNAARIFSDSRMFLTPVPSKCGLAYVGTAGMRQMTLGGWIEWWLNAEGNPMEDEKGNEALTYHLAGSPLSGANACRCIYPDGTTREIVHHPFHSLFRDFIAINNRYRTAREQYESYTLNQVVDILTAQPQDEAILLNSRLLISEARYRHVQQQAERYRKNVDALQAKCDDVCRQLHINELTEVADEWVKRRAKYEEEVAGLDRQRRELKKQLMRSELSLKAYQQSVHPLTEKKKRLKENLAMFRMNIIDTFKSTANLADYIRWSSEKSATAFHNIK